jgi:RNA polymerase sigma factor (sigma-70 family)
VAEKLDPDEFDRLRSIAEGTARKVLKGSPSAIHNLLEDVASRAVFEHWWKVQQGEEIESPERYVATIARRRALNAQRDRLHCRDLRLGRHDSEVEGAMLVDRADIPFVPVAPPDSAEIVRLIGDAVRNGGDETDVLIARRLWIDGRSVDEIAQELGIAAKTVRNRATTIKERIRDSLG